MLDMFNTFTIETVMLIFFGLSAFFLFISLFMRNGVKKDISELKDFSFEQSQDIFHLKERISALERHTGSEPMNTQTLSFTSELSFVNEITRENIIGLYSQGRTPEEISVFTNTTIEIVHMIIDKYIKESTK